MKNVLMKLPLFSATFVLLTVFSASFNAQVKEDNLISIYKYRAGYFAAYHLLNDEKCSVVAGNVTDVNSMKVGFSIEERLLGDYPAQDTVEFDYMKTMYPLIQIIAGKPMSYPDEFNKESKLIIFFCKTYYTKYGRLTSIEALFPGIRKSVAHFINYQKNPDILLQIPDLIKDETDLTFITYLAEFASGLDHLSQSNNKALVLIRLLESDKITALSRGRIIWSLANLLKVNTVFPIMSATRDTVFRNLVETASGEKSSAAAAIAVLEKIMEFGGTDLRPYLKIDHKIRIRENLGKLQIPYETNEEKAALESLLTFSEN